MVGVSVACSSIELVPSVDLLYIGGYRWWGVSVACSSIELLPSVQWRIQIVLGQCRLFL